MQKHALAFHWQYTIYSLLKYILKYSDINIQNYILCTYCFLQCFKLTP